MKMLKEEETHERYSTGLAQCYGQRNRLADVKGKWKEFQSSVRKVAEESLQGRPQTNKVWLQEDTLELVEKKRLTFPNWQEGTYEDSLA